MLFHEIQGERVPALGFGTYKLTGQECVEGVMDALELGYRHIDTAQSYENEAEVGEAIRRSGVNQEELFLVSKVKPSNYPAGRARESTLLSLERLGVERIDLMLLHWPPYRTPLEEPLSDLIELVEEGAVRRIGVSNFPTSLVERAAEIAPLFCNQVEYHPFLSQRRVAEQAEELDLLITGYRPLAAGRVNESPLLRKLGEKYGKTPAQAALRWQIQQPRVATIPKSATHERRKENIDLFDFELSASEMSAVHALADGTRFVNPEDGPEWDE